MTTVTLAPDLAQQIENITGKDDAEATRFVDKAIRTYLTQMRREKIRTETEAFNAQFDKLLAKYRGQYVAVHKGHVIDHDTDLRALHLRVYAELGHTPVLLKQVLDKPERELVFRSPRLEKHKI